MPVLHAIDIRRVLVWERIKAGWEPERAITEPPRGKRKW
jgi:hypothetical protein